MADTPQGGTGGKTDDVPGREPREPGRIPGWVWVVVIGVGALWLIDFASRIYGPAEIAYSDFKTFVARGEITEATVGAEVITGTVRRKPEVTEPASPEPLPAELEEKDTFSFRTLRVEDPELVQELLTAGAEVVGVNESSAWKSFAFTLLLLTPFLLVLLFMSRGIASARRSVMGFGKGSWRHFVTRATGVTFDDVAGCDESKYELQEVVSFLKNPDRYRKIGASIPKGVLLAGPPGTGKTLLARAVAGEAGVPFFSMSGSDFVEMFVGVGASRVRDLFAEAKKHAPCIIFLDELDAIGRQRGVHVGAVNDEREQTLNQLLVEMDGFEPNAGVIMLAATNRPDVLDSALLRPGRFDRQVVLDAPDLEGRVAILKVHARGKKLADDVDLRPIAKSTPGFSGADLANALNEAALLAARHDRSRITQNDIEEAVERVVAGPERKSRRLSEEEKRRVAVHESGHAVVAAHCEHADPVHKISIVPRGHAALGYTMQFPTEDQYLKTQDELLDNLRGLLGGRAAEEVVLGQVSTGAESDLKRATTIARQIICFYGMGESVGLTHCGKRPVPAFLGDRDYSGSQVDCSDETARQIDKEVKALLAKCYNESKAIIARHRFELGRVSDALLAHETLDQASFRRLLEAEPAAESKPVPGAQPETARS